MLSFNQISFHKDFSPKTAGELKHLSTDGIRFHMVVAHERLLQSGKTVLVRAHSRGNARIGIVHKQRNIDSAAAIPDNAA